MPSASGDAPAVEFGVTSFDVNELRRRNDRESRSSTMRVYTACCDTPATGRR